MANVSRRTRNIRLKQITYHLNWGLFIGKQGLITLKKVAPCENLHFSREFDTEADLKKWSG